MTKQYNNSVFIFHRDLRLEDNTGLILALEKSINVLPIFIFTPTQIDPYINHYRSNNAVQFMIESIIDLNKQLENIGSRLFLFLGNNTEILEALFNEKLGLGKYDAIFFNKDCTPFARERDQKISDFCKNKKISCITCEDYTLQPIGSVLSGSGEPYKMFTPFFKKAETLKVNKPTINTYKNYLKKNIKFNFELKIEDTSSFFKTNNYIEVRGGRDNALNKLKNLQSKFGNYNEMRNIPYAGKTTRLSAYNKFGCVSIREVYWAFKNQLESSNNLIQQLYWRDFYMNMMWFYPHYTQSVTSPKFNNIKWINNPLFLNAWKEGKTGYPIIDASMNQMNKTGFMENRCRMIVASFLTFNLGINWKEGEKYFSRTLVDIALPQNLGNWKWVAGIESYSNPYFRIMSPISQAERFDPDAKYIKEWLPQLKNIPSKELLDWENNYHKYDLKNILYYKPIVNSKETRKEAILRYKNSIIDSK